MPDNINQPAGPESPRNRLRVPDPQRFRVSRGTLRFDAFMTRFIFVGGLGVIIAIFGIFFFILAQILPLFGRASVERLGTVETGVAQPLLIGTDEWTELPFVLAGDGTVRFIDLSGRRPPQESRPPLPAGTQVTAADYDQERQTLALGLSDGSYVLATISYQPVFAADGTRTIDATVKWDKPTALADAGTPLAAIAFNAGERRKTVAALSGGAARRLLVDTLVQKRSLFGASGFSRERRSDLTEAAGAEPVQTLVGANGETLVARCGDGAVRLFRLEGGQWTLRQTFSPFAGSGSAITSMAFIKGDVSLSFTSAAGEHALFSLYRSADAGERLYGETKRFDDFPGGATTFAASGRNKAFLLGNASRISLRYATTADTRWEADTEAALQHLVISGKFDRIIGADAAGRLQLYALDDPHPEAGFRAFFGKLWYEGQDEPKYLWQSTGGSDDFEPKLSLVPLVVGSLKGTFYALIFAVPIALLAAVYTSQFLTPGLKRVIKPGIEIMASLPSVVLGFIGALWLAPLVEDRMPSVLLVLVAIPASAVLIGWLWNLLPIRIRILIPRGWEFGVFVPVIILVAVAAWRLGPPFEALAFRVADPAGGPPVGDFRLWWEAWSGSQFQQRNSLIVGFMMGFAVIPIIYTIAEDALSAVPPSMVSASLALGASRWQTTARIIVPTASAGIFSACMIGLGRAVGETMIVVMATGNTPILDFDIFSGMRTLSANIAVELPEAPHGGTLYRTLFLGAFVLFILTFIVNTLAETLRHRLRERFKTTG